ncbi:MAG: hypothetical protein FJ087_22100, partial [Deltaproteobacteria bacterium]|nr:hypothetical protein [Deltaproteobacteria bacterium]
MSDSPTGRDGTTRDAAPAADPDAEIRAIEAGYARGRRRKRIVAIVLVAVLAAVIAVLAVGIVAQRPTEATALTRLVTDTLPRLEMTWFDTRALGMDGSDLSNSQAAFRKAADAFVAEAADVEETLEAPAKGLVAWMEAVPRNRAVDVKTDQAKAALGAWNDALATLSPRYFVEAEPFRGVLDQRAAVIAAMLLVYEVLGVQCYLDSSGGAAFPVRGVRRVDPLPATSLREGYVRQDDLSAAFVLHDEATRDAARVLLPGVDAPDRVFTLRFGDTVRGDLAEPYSKLVRRAIDELRAGSGASPSAFDHVARLLARRQALAKRIEKKAEDAGIATRLKVPGGLIWPRPFANQVRGYNAELRAAGEELLATEDDLGELERIARDLSEEEPARAATTLSRFLSSEVGFHEARHVADLKAAPPLSACITERVFLRDNDERFLRDVQAEGRAFLTSLISAPATTHLQALDMLGHLYRKRGNAYFYAVRILLTGVAFPPGEA